MRVLSSILFLVGAIIAHASAPIPYAGKLSVDQINYSGNAKFSFEILDINGTLQWKNGNDRIEVPVNRGRYLVLLGGQGMNPLPTELIHRDISLFLRVRVDLGDGEGVRLLSPDVAISTSPRALAAEIAKLADRAITASTARSGSITKDAFSASTQSQYGHLFNPNISEFSMDGLTPRFANAGSSIPVRLGDSLTLSAPSTPGAKLTYKWKRNGQFIEGANQPSLQITADEAVYTVTADNALGSSEARFSTYRIKGSRFSTSSHSMWIDEDGSLWGVGKNNYGQLGDGTTVSKSIPVKVVEKGVVAVEVGEETTFFIKSDGSLWAMGFGWFGVMGTGNLSNQNIPVKILDNGCRDVSTGERHTLILRSDYTLWGMGRNDMGQLGNGVYDPHIHTESTRQLHP